MLDCLGIGESQSKACTSHPSSTGTLLRVVGRSTEVLYSLGKLILSESHRRRGQNGRKQVSGETNLWAPCAESCIQRGRYGRPNHKTVHVFVIGTYRYDPTSLPLSATITSSDEDSYLEGSSYEDLGIIELCIYPVDLLNTPHVPGPSTDLSALKLHERSKKAVTQQITLVAPIPRSAILAHLCPDWHSRKSFQCPLTSLLLDALGRTLSNSSSNTVR